VTGTKPLQVQLDDIVLDVLERQLLRPERLEQLLAGLLENSEAANGRRRIELAEARRQETIARSSINRLLELIETGAMSARDPAFVQRLAIHKSTVSLATSRVESLERQLSSGRRQITSHAIARFGEFAREQLRGTDPALRNAYVRLLVQEVTVSDTAITIRGSKAALEHALVKEEKPLHGVVPIFDREWCPEEDSNLHAVASAST
jgi:site-specific DNA recombinase